MNAPDILTYGHKTILEAFEGMTDAEWSTVGATSTWTAKDVLSHITSFEVMLKDALLTMVEPRASAESMTKYGPATYEQWNASEVAARKNTSPADVLAEYQAVHQAVVELAGKITPEAWREVGTIPWYGAEYSLDDFLVYTNYAHKREHASMLTMFRRLLKAGQIS